jgi:type I restriction enzyme S subunit
MHKGHARRSIGDLCDFFNGNGFRPPDWSASGLPIIRIQNLNGSQNFNYFDGTPKPKWIVEPGDLLFAWAGVKGVSFGPTIWPGPRGVLNQHIFRVVPKKGIDKYWLYLALQVATRRIEANAHGFKASLVHVQKDDITNQVVDLPPLAEQRCIAELLQTWEASLEKLIALRAAKVQRLEGIAQQLLAPSRAIGRGVPRSNWGSSSFGEVFEERQDKNAGLISDDVVTVGKYAIRKQSEHFTRSVASKDLSNYWTISPGDFVYDPMSAYYGAIGRYSGSADGIVSPAYRVIKLSPDVDPEFMVALIRTHHIRFLLETRSSQGNKEGKRRLLQRDEFESIEFTLPPLETQREIAAKLAVFRADFDLTVREIEALTRQKRGLMQKLLTGEWRVCP